MKSVEVILSPEEAFQEDLFLESLYHKLQLKNDGNTVVQPVKRSIDARSRNVIVRVQCEIASAKERKPVITYS
ncbi:MAG TPA: FAD-binding protein, partial [Ohtaekwangia sp.]